MFYINYSIMWKLLEKVSNEPNFYIPGIINASYSASLYLRELALKITLQESKT